MGLGRRIRRAVRRVGRVVTRGFRRTIRGVGDMTESIVDGTIDGIGGMLGGKEDNTQNELLKYQNSLLEESKRKKEELIKQQKLKEQEDAKVAEQMAKEQTALTDSQKADVSDFASSGTDSIDTSWLDGVIDEEEGLLENADDNIIV